MQVKLKVHKTKKEQTLNNKGFAPLHYKQKQCPKCKYRRALRINEIIYLEKADVIFSVCPRCNRAIEREYMEYCTGCGQKLSWVGFEDIEITVK